jgi:tetratricopeptide (TPR) repeat protein
VRRVVGRRTEEAPADLLERDEELALLEAVVDAVERGDGRAVVLEGAVGVGKTALLAAATALAERRGLTVLHARCGPLERDFAFGAVRQLLEAPLRALDDGVREELVAGPAAHGASLLGLGAPQPPSSVGVDPAFAALHGLLWLVTGLQDHGPVIVAVDDVQWCDQPSARFLAYLASRLDRLAVAVLVTLRRPAADEPPPAVGELLAAPHTTIVSPAPLTVAGSAALLADALGRDAEEPFATAVHRLTGGNPFLISALGSALAEDGIAPTAAEAPRLEELVPATVSRAVLLRLRPLPGDARTVARAVAVLGPTGSVAEAARVASLSPAAAAAAADALARAGVFDHGRPLRFVHPLVAAAVGAELEAGEREALHAAAARALADGGAPPGRVGAHLLAAGRTGDPWVVARLDEAAADALRRGAPETAVALWTRALAEGAPGADRVGLLLARGRAAARANLPDAVDALQEALDAAAGTPFAAEAALELGRALLMSGRVRDAVAVVDAAMRAGPSPLDPAADPHLVELESELLTAARMDLGLVEMVPERVGRATPRSEAGDAAARLLLAQRAYLTATLGHSAEETVALARRALDGGALLRDRGPEAPEVVLAANALSLAEALDEADAALSAALDEAQRRGSALGFLNALCWRAQVRFRTGDVPRAESDAATSIEVAGEHGWGLGLPAVAAFLADAQLARGDLDAAERTLALTGVADEVPDLAMVLPVLVSRASLRRSRGDLEGALADLLECGRRLERWHSPNPSVIPWRSRAARVLAALGRPGEAQRFAQEEVVLAERFGAPMALGIALHAAGMAEPATVGSRSSSAPSRRSSGPPGAARSPTRCSTSAASSASGARRSPPASRCAAPWTSPTAAAPTRSRRTRTWSCWPPAGARAARRSPASTR